jgi:glyoxylase-like metal-dependent hydrolase (beta-lactamase superfamily II)
VGRAIDVMHLGLDRIICVYEVDGFVVDPGPASCLPTLLQALGDDRPRALLLTHVHLDHAGAAGSLVRRFPELPVYVHARGAPHVADPSKLVASAARLYGANMEPFWGEILPVPEGNLRVLEGGERFEGFRVAYTPGHAWHHVSFLHEATGDAYVGDVAGVSVPPFDLVAVPSPPPDIDVEAWERSLDAVEGWAPRRLCITHFGPVDGVERHLERVREGLRTWARRALDGREAFARALEREVREAGGDELLERFFLTASADALWAGFDRYWRTARAAERTAWASR